jgi:riboflavin biosynthesis pyrimidine reductase
MRDGIQETAEGYAVRKMSRDDAFLEFADRKTREAEQASIPCLRTDVDVSSRWAGRAIGNSWSRQHYDGDFHLLRSPPLLPAVSLVFVQSSDGNTATPNPEQLGGGTADTHVIYEGLTRVAADAVLAGAATAAGAHAFFSVWHPEIVALRRECALPRHPIQIVVSNDGHVNLDALLFNVPDVPAILIAGPGCRNRCGTALADRPWITVLPLVENGLRGAFARLRSQCGVSRISSIGGRRTASALVDAGLVQDLHLTTAARSGGKPGTPWYVGAKRPVLETIVKKHDTSEPAVVFEHLAIDSSRTSPESGSYQAT